MPELRPVYDLLRELKRRIEDKPRFRLHVHPDSAMWLGIAVSNSNLERHVTVVPDPDVSKASEGWVEDLSAEQWAALRALVGQRVRVRAHRSIEGSDHEIGPLIVLTDNEAIVGAGDNGSQFYLRWISVEPEEEVTT